MPVRGTAVNTKLSNLKFYLQPIRTHTNRRRVVCVASCLVFLGDEVAETYPAHRQDPQDYFYCRPDRVRGRRRSRKHSPAGKAARDGSRRPTGCWRISRSIACRGIFPLDFEQAGVTH